ncbi:nucleoside/nucleotide kinase family protein [Martelella mediterranea]|uniref:nucleoside/nucleotide kinase family protein n=1 Tax=Martelella mediterranea TaxID=293089 RepID=UPI001E4C4C3E|nr:nucleoside/nucleotide kinase family protein [Martelella mediterranea]MCD1635824.1 nucleoside/nucleotide kinase family protein [Martelella mediterranea]
MLVSAQKSLPTDETDLRNRLISFAQGDVRRFVAIAGAPASGKSTLAERLFKAVEAEAPGRVAVLPMDGFHYDNAVLQSHGWLARKGAPHTFDLDGLACVLDRLARGDRPVAVPVFDRALEISRAGASVIAPSARLILVEGNYLLLDEPGWKTLHERFDLSLYLDVPLALLRQRLLERWRSLQPEEARAKIEENDLPNAKMVIEHSIAADLVLKT